MNITKRPVLNVILGRWAASGSVALPATGGEGLERVGRTCNTSAAITSITTVLERTELRQTASYPVSGLLGSRAKKKLEDNVLECRSRLYDYFAAQYTERFGPFPDDGLSNSVKYILGRNIVWGDALTLQTVDENSRPIVFSEWSFLMNGMVKRRDFSFSELLYQSENNSLPLFSDIGEDVFIPEPEKEFPPVHYLKIGEMETTV
jgi:hypothetical protein